MIRKRVVMMGKNDDRVIAEASVSISTRAS